MAQLGHMDWETSLEYVHIQQRALERAKQLIESEQKEILAIAEGRPRTNSETITTRLRTARSNSPERPHRSRRSQLLSRRKASLPSSSA